MGHPGPFCVLWIYFLAGRWRLILRGAARLQEGQSDDRT
jgi:hypothetical protein